MKFLGVAAIHWNAAGLPTGVFGKLAVSFNSAWHHVTCALSFRCEPCCVRVSPRPPSFFGSVMHQEQRPYHPEADEVRRGEPNCSPLPLSNFQTPSCVLPHSSPSANISLLLVLFALLAPELFVAWHPLRVFCVSILTLSISPHWGLPLLTSSLFVFPNC